MSASEDAGRRIPRAQRGAYGLQLAGMAADASWLVDAADGWPLLTIERGTLDAPRAGVLAGAMVVGEDDAECWLSAEQKIVLRRHPLTASFLGAPAIDDEALGHPYLALPAVIANQWLGREVFHAGAFLHDGRAWALVGGKGVGKSSTLALLAEQGTGIVTDDVLVTDGATVHAGPRTIDLREATAEVLGGQPLGRVGARERWRLRPSAVPATAPLAGFIHLQWGDKLGVGRLSGRERLTRLGEQRAFPPTSAAASSILELAALRHLVLTRPPRIEMLDVATALLLDTLSRPA